MSNKDERERFSGSKILHVDFDESMQYDEDFDRAYDSDGDNEDFDDLEYEEDRNPDEDSDDGMEDFDDIEYDEEPDDEEYDEEDPDEVEYDDEDPDDEEYDDEEDPDEAEYDEEDPDDEEYDDEEDPDEAEYDDEDPDDEEYDDDEDPDDEKYDDEEYDDADPDHEEYDHEDADDEGAIDQYAPRQSGSRTKSARPRPVAYVPIEEGDLDLPELSSRKKHKGLKVTGVAALMVLVSAGCAYAGVSYYYSDKFFEGTSINGMDCAGMTPYEVEQMIAKNVENYSIEVSSRNLEPQVIDGSLIDYKYAPDGEVMKLLKGQKPYEWIRGLFEEKQYTITENVTYSKEMLQNQILQLDCAKEENQVAPENAYVAFADTQFEIVPETQGSELNVKQAYQILDDAVAGKQAAIDFASNSEAYVAAAVTSEDPGLRSTLDACNNFTKANITYTFGDQSVTLDGTTIKDWLAFDEKGQLVEDGSFQQHIKEYVAQLAAQYDTVGTDREFYTTSGRTVYVYGSAYGWKIDQEAETAQLTQEIQSGTQTTREPVYKMTANSRGVNDLGNTYIEVDLSSQHMYYYQDGTIIFDSDIVSGNMSYSDRQTPPGIFTLYYKKSPDVLKGAIGPDGKPEYETPVDYWMPFNGGIGFHDASWQPYFGGDRYLYGGSHGCINLPPSNAAILYSIIQTGVPIICFY